MNENTSSALLVALTGLAGLHWHLPMAVLFALLTCALATVTSTLRLAAAVYGSRRAEGLAKYIAVASWGTAVAGAAALFI